MTPGHTPKENFKPKTKLGKDLKQAMVRFVSKNGGEISFKTTNGLVSDIHIRKDI